MTDEKIVPALVTGGEATAGPPLGPTLAPLGLNVVAIVKEINAQTSDYPGMRVPVKIIVNTDTKQFRVEVGTPTTSALLAKEAGVQKGSGTPNSDLVGDLKMEQLVKIARAKMPQTYASNVKSGVRELLGACVSMGIKVEGLNPRDALLEVGKGKWDSLLVD